jgi:hypothetical protein
MKYVFRYVLPSIFVIAGVLYAVSAAAHGSTGKIFAGIIVAVVGAAAFFVMRWATKDLG